MRKTKIICTIGPKTSSFEALQQLSAKGMNIARLNMSHGTHEWHRTVIKNIKTINKKTGSPVAILLDTKGPEIRTGDVVRDIVLHKGDTLTLTIRRQAELEPYCVEINYDGFATDVTLGDIVLIDGGMLALKVVDVLQKDIQCKCIDGGVLSSRRHVNIRGKSADLPSITEKDWQDIAFGIENCVDFIALSFVKRATAIEEVQRYITQKKAPIDNYHRHKVFL